MRVVVASRNPVKLAATQQAFAAQFPSRTVQVLPTKVDSGAGDQPASDSETRRGARTRAVRAREALPDADFWVGIEGGIELIDEQLMGFAWMAVQGLEGDISEARSVTLPLPPAVKELVAGGMELGEANDRVFSTVNSKQAGGAFGLLTAGRYTRESVYAQTLCIALVPFVNVLYPQAETNRQEARGD